MTALAVTGFVVLLVVVLGFWSGRDKQSRSSIEEWSVGGRRFGAFIVWFLVGADIYTAYTFLGLTGYGYNFGVPAFFAVPYVVIAYPIAYFFLPRVWKYAAKYKLTTLSDFVRERFQSRLLSVLVALSGILFLVPYIDLQLSGITGVVQVAGQGVFKNTAAVGTTALVVSFLLVALYTFFSGMRAPAWTAVIKDLLVWIVMFGLVLTIPYIWFGGWGNMIHTAIIKYPKLLTLPGKSPHGSMNSLWFSTAALISALALFMWPHSSTGALSSRSAEALRKNMVFLPFYNLLLFFITWLGVVAFMVLPAHPHDKTFGNFALLHLIHASYPNGVIQGLMYATVALASLVPASIMVLAASNLFATNILKDWLMPSLSDSSVTLIARGFVFVITLIALIFGILFPTSLIGLQLEGASGIVQILPAVFLSLYWRRLSSTAVTIGLVGGIAMVFLNHFTLHLPGYDGFWGLLVNLVLVILLNFAFQGQVEKNLETNKLLKDELV